jgi:hypothetical protein
MNIRKSAMSYLVLILVILAPVAYAEPAGTRSYCNRLPFDKEVPAALPGSYDIIGKDAATGNTYAGTLQVDPGKNSYLLTRTVRGRTLKGEAWMESCGPDQFQRLMVRYESKARAIEIACYLVGDGDNFIRASCTTPDGRGFEAWYQRYDVSAP